MTTPGESFLSFRLRRKCEKILGRPSWLIPASSFPPGQAFVGFEAGQKCFPKPVVSNDGGTARVDFVPTGTEFLDECIDENGQKTKGLTIEGELNKVRRPNTCFLFDALG